MERSDRLFYHKTVIKSEVSVLNGACLCWKCFFADFVLFPFVMGKDVKTQKETN